jgi:tripartite motif-containing protein 71
MSDIRIAGFGVVAAVILVATSSLPASPVAARAQAAPRGLPAGAVAQVRYIYHGLGVQPPRQARRAAHQKDPLYDQYALLTGTAEKASIGFADGTALHINQRTDAVISAHLTTVKRGEAAEYLAPGTDHAIKTDSATATSIGTTYDVSTDGSTSTFVVLHGALSVSNALGSVVVKSNQQTKVTTGHAPLPPSPVDALAVFAWTAGIPTPDLGEDIALDANGGSIVSFSSQRTDQGDAGAARHINDGLLSQGWESGTGKTSNQTVTMGFFGGNFYRISDIIIDPAATFGDPSSEDLKSFSIRVSSSGTNDASFTTIFNGTCRRKDALQHFHLPAPVRAKYVQLVAVDNYGSAKRVAVAEWEVVATASLFAQPTAVAVGPQGAVFVTDTNANRVDELSPRGRVIAQWGSKGRGPGQFVSPEGIAVDAHGTIYVVDRYNNRIEKLSPQGKFLLSFGSSGLADGQFQFPRGIAIDKNGNVYVSDLAGSITDLTTFFLRIQKFSPQGKLLKAWDFVADAGQVPSAGGMAIDRNGRLWVANPGAGTVLEVSSAGTVLRTVGSPGSGPGQFSEPTDVTVDAKGNLYVADSFNSRIQRISPSGQVMVWGKFGFARGQYALPEGLAIGPNGLLYVADTHNGRIQVLASTTGKVKTMWGKYATVPTVLGQPGGLAVDPNGNVWVTDGANDRIQVRNPNGHVAAVLGYHGVVTNAQRGLGQFFYPQGIAIDKQGEAYVADSDNSRIQELAPRGPIGEFGSLGSGEGQFQIPWAVALDSAGNIYVTDAISDRVQKFSPSGKVIWSVGSSGTAPGQFSFPDGIAVDQAGNVYVANRGSGSQPDGRIEKLGPDGKLLAVWGTSDALGQTRFAAPGGLAIDGQGNVYVADGGHDAIQKLSPDGKVLEVFEMPGPNGFPVALALDKSGNIYVADALNSRVDKLSPTGEVLAIWG